MTWLARTRRRAWEVLEVGGRHDPLSRTIDLMIMALVVGNVVAVTLESVESIEATYHELFLGFEKISVAAFTAEFLLRLWSAREAPGASGTPLRRRLAYLCSPMAIVDALAIAPFYLATFLALDLRFLRVLRLLRIVKLTRYSTALMHLGDAFRLQRSALAVSYFLMSIAIVIAASFAYAVEKDAQPVAFGSIPAAMWWAVCTLTTVGYGDVAPVTPIGKALASVIQLIGIAMVALPTSLFASGFAHILHRSEQALEDEAAHALADGLVTADEAAAYAELAEQLHVAPEFAEDIIVAARRRRHVTDHDACPHCGKALD